MATRLYASVPHHDWEGLLEREVFPLRVEMDDTSNVRLRVVDTGPLRWLETTSGPAQVRREAGSCVEDDRYLIMPFPRTGRFRYVRGRRTGILGPHQTMLGDSTSPYLFEQLDASRYLALRIEPAPVLARLPNALQTGPVDLQRGAGALAAGFVHDAWRRLGVLTAADRTHVAGVVLDLLALALASSNASDAPQLDPAAREAHLRQAMRFLLDNLHDPLLSPDWCAREIGVSRRYLDRLFAAQEQTTAGFIREERLLRCREALRSPLRRHLPVEEIAYAAGFVSASHFSRAYKSRFGRTPTEERRAAS